MKIHEVTCQHCGAVWQTTPGPLYDGKCKDKATRRGCGGALPTREQVLEAASREGGGTVDPWGSPPSDHVQVAH